jgi:urease accessory protein
MPIMGSTVTAMMTKARMSGTGMTTEPVLSNRALLRLMTWLSPAFPVGAFSYSHGLETAISAGLIRDRTDLTEWLADLVERGSGWNDLVLAAVAFERSADEEDIRTLGSLAEALAGSRERYLETVQQGSAFLQAAATWGVPLGALSDLPYPVAVGAASGRMAIPKPAFLAAFAQAFMANLVQVAVRLVPIGQSQGLKAMAELEPIALGAAERAVDASLDDLGASTFLSDIQSMRHETQYSRVFRS